MRCSAGVHSPLPLSCRISAQQITFVGLLRPRGPTMVVNSVGKSQLAGHARH
jgi:hypothetical protein